MTTPTELSEAHLQDHELISAALEASSLSPNTSSAVLPPFKTAAPQGLHVNNEDSRSSPEAPLSPSAQSPDLLTTPRTDASRTLSSPPNPLLPSTPSTLDTRNSVKFTLLMKEPAQGTAGETQKATERERVTFARDEDDPPSQGESAEPEDGTEELALDPVLFAALNHHRDRFLLLRAEVELERFLANPAMTRLPLAPPYFQPALNSYQRLLVHRLADTFGITREVEAAPPTIWNAGAINPATGQPQGVVVLVKGENTRLPPAKLATYAPAPEMPAPVLPSNIVVPSPSSTPSIASSPITSAGPSASTSSLPNLVESSSVPAQQPTTPQILKILPRSSASRTTSSASSSIGTDEDPATSSSAPPSAKGKGRRELTLEEREAAYKEARERIFSQPEQERSVPAVPSASSVVSEDIGTRLASAGAGITRPSSAGSTFSRSSAALSVAGSRPSPSVASESGSSMWSGHHGGIYGGGSQLMPSLRPSAPSFDPSLAAAAGWIPPDYGGGGHYLQDPSWHHHPQYPPQFSHPPIQVTAPPVHAPYPAPSPTYASSSTSSNSGPMPPTFPSGQQPFVQVDAWGRPIPPPLPSPSLSNSSGSSMQRPQTHRPSSTTSTTTSERSTSANSGYLMRFADTGAVVTPGGTVTAGPPPPSFPSPSSSIFVGPPSTTRNVSSFSSNSQQSLGSGGSSRTAASSSGGGAGAGGSRVGAPGSTGSRTRRPSGSLASSVSSVVSGGGGDPRTSITGESGEVGTADSKKRDRQTTIRRPPSGSSDVEATPESKKVGPHEDSSPLHPSLPAKPVWVATTKAPRPRSPPPSAQCSSTSPVSSIRADRPIQSQSTPITAPQQPPSAPHPTSSNANYHDNLTRQSQSHYPSYPHSGLHHQAPPFYGQPPQSFSPGGPPPPVHAQQPQNSSWDRPTGLHYPAAPSFVPNAAPGSQYPIGGGGGYGPSNPALPPTWSYSQPQFAPPSPVAPQYQQQINSRSQPPSSSDAMPFPDIRRPPPKSTQLFDPNRPSGGGRGQGMRRGVSGAGSIRSVSGTRASLD